MTAYFTDPMGDEFKKALEKALKQAESKKGEDDPNTTKRATESGERVNPELPEARRKVSQDARRSLFANLIQKH